MDPLPPGGATMPLVTRATAVMSLAAVVFGTISVVAPGARAAGPEASFSFSPTAPLTGAPVTFVSESRGFVEPQRWDLDGDRICDDASGPTAQRSFPVAGRYAITLCIADATGDQGAQTRTVTVHNRPPAAAFTYAPAAPVRGEPILLTS